MLAELNKQVNVNIPSYQPNTTHSSKPKGKGQQLANLFTVYVLLC